ncbi:MAG: hypothetical protein ACJASH_002610 [Bermanella sp.]|jgi:hypothetical protein
MAWKQRLLINQLEEILVGAVPALLWLAQKPQ